MMSKQRKVTYIQGEASFVNSTTLKVKKTAGGEETLQFDKIIIATGSSPRGRDRSPRRVRIFWTRLARWI